MMIPVHRRDVSEVPLERINKSGTLRAMFSSMIFRTVISSVAELHNLYAAPVPGEHLMRL
jgi:hypothetical protein